MADISGINVKLFSNPEIKADLSVPNKKLAQAKQLSTFNKIQEQSVEKLQQLEDFITYQVQLRFDNFKAKVRGVELNRLLRQDQAPHAIPDQLGAQPAPRPQAYKPVEAFLEGRKKSYPWFTVQSTGVSLEEQECISDYIDSGGFFNDVQTPVKFIKRLLDHETLRAFLPALDKAINGGMPHKTKTIVDTLNNVLVNRMPK